MKKCRKVPVRLFGDVQASRAQFSKIVNMRLVGSQSSGAIPFLLYALEAIGAALAFSARRQFGRSPCSRPLTGRQTFQKRKTEVPSKLLRTGTDRRIRTRSATIATFF